MPDIKVSENEFKRMQRQIAKLNALEAGGVDNWQWYDESLAEWHKENEIDELIDVVIDDFNELLVNAEVDQPAGQGCGYAVIVNETELAKLLRNFADAHSKIKAQE